MRYRSHLPNYLPKCVFLGKHVIEIGPFANYVLDPLGVQVMRKPHPIVMTVSFHLEYKLADLAEAKATVPSRI